MPSILGQDPHDAGRVPVNLLLPRFSNAKLGIVPHSDGRVPFKELLPRYTATRDGRALAKAGGSVPCKRLPLRSRNCRLRTCAMLLC